MILGVDVDGVLADFNAAFRKRVGITSGRWLIPEGFEPTTWAYPTTYGYTIEEEQAAWNAIKADPAFWWSLSGYPGTARLVHRLAQLGRSGHEIYYITTRLGVSVKSQTELWLGAQGHPGATVLIAKGSKGLIASGLGLTHFIDDRDTNCLAVREHSPQTKVYMPRWAYNATTPTDRGIRVLDRPDDFLEHLQ